MNWWDGNLRVKSLEATVTLEYCDFKTAQAIAKAVFPDNLKAPPGLQIETFYKENKVITQISFNGKLTTFASTIDDLLFSTSTAEKALNAIARKA